MEKRLYKYLTATDGHIGRSGRQMKLIADRAKVSVHMLQSVASGRRVFGDEAAERVDKVLTPLEEHLKKMPRK